MTHPCAESNPRLLTIACRKAKAYYLASINAIKRNI